MPTTTANLRRVLSEAKAIRADNASKQRLETWPRIALAHGWELDLVRGVVLSAGGIDLGAVDPPETVEQVKAVIAEVAALVPTHSEASKRAAIRGLSMYRVRTRGPRISTQGKATRGTITLTDEQWQIAKEAGAGNVSAGVRLAIEALQKQRP